MSPLHFLVAVFAAFAASRAVLRWRSRELSASEMFFWLSIWGSVIVITFFPLASADVAELLGVGRGVDVAFFLAIIVLLYLLFRIYVKLDRVDKDITTVVLLLSIKDASAKQKKLKR